MWTRYDANNPDEPFPPRRSDTKDTPWLVDSRSTADSTGTRVTLRTHGYGSTDPAAREDQSTVCSVVLSPEDALHLARELVFYAGRAAAEVAAQAATMSSRTADSEESR